MAATAKKAPTVQRDMEKVLATAAALKEQLNALLGEDNADAITLRDTIEGETDLFEIIDKVALQIGEDDSQVDGLKTLKTTLDGRRARLEQRADNLRAMLLNALDMLGEQKLERPIATISLRPIAPKLIVTDEAAVPSAYWKQPAPVLARKELGDAIKDRKAAIAKAHEEHVGGLITQEVLDQRLAQIEREQPPVPGADLDNGGVTVQVRFG